ncbi:MAG: hypothetical protein SPK04_05865, partial [Succinivibrionaceae bacterium]|nr:hypothetical protein [Succinivibrionaceae bacterium]
MLNSFKNAMLQKLSDKFNNEQLQIIFQAVDLLSNQFSIVDLNTSKDKNAYTSNEDYLSRFTTSKKIEGCSE